MLSTNNTRYLWWRTRLAIILPLIVFVIFVIDAPLIRIFLLGLLTLGLGWLTTLYIRKIDLYEMQQSESIFLPIILLAISSLCYWLIIGILNTVLSVPILIDYLRPEASQIVFAAICTLIWSYVALSIPYTRQISLLQEDAILMASETFEQKLGDLEVQIDNVQSRSETEVTSSELLSQIKTLVEEIRAYSKGQRINKPKEFAPIRMWERFSPIGALILALLMSLLGEFLKQWFFK